MPRQVTLHLAWSDFPPLFQALSHAIGTPDQLRMVVLWGSDRRGCESVRQYWQQVFPTHPVQDLGNPPLTEQSKNQFHASANLLVLNVTLPIWLQVTAVPIVSDQSSHRLITPPANPLEYRQATLTFDADEIASLLNQPAIANLPTLPIRFRLKFSGEAMRQFWMSLLQVTQSPSAPQHLSTAVPDPPYLPESLAHYAPIGILLVGSDGGITRANPAFCELTGYTESQLRHLDNQFISHPEDFATEVRLMRQMLQEGQQHSVLRKRYRRNDGSFIWTEVKLSLLVDGATGDSTIVTFVTDLSDRKLAEQEIQQSREREALFNDISTQIRAALDLSSILQVAVERLRHALDTDRVLAYQFLPDYSGICLAEAVSGAYPIMRGQRFSSECIPVAYLEAYRQGRLWSTADIQTAGMTACHRLMLEEFAVQGTISTAIISMDEALEPQNRQLWGLLVVHHCRDVRQWTTDEEHLVRAVANQIAIALEHNRLLHQLQIYTQELEDRVSQRTRSLERSLQFEQLIRTLTETLRRDLDEDQMLKESVQGLVKTLNVDGCIASLFDPQQSLLKVRYEFFRRKTQPQSSLVEKFQSCSLKPQSSECYQSLLSGKSYLDSIPLHQLPLQDAELTPLVLESGETLEQATDALVYRVVCPIIDDQSLLGVLTVFQVQSRQFEAEEINLIEQVASQCAIALRRAILYRQEHEQRLSAEYFRLFLEKSNDIFVEYDSTLRYISINPAGCQLLGRPASEIIGKTNQELIGRAAHSIDQMISYAFDSGEKVFCDHQFFWDGVERVFEIIYAPITNPAGEVQRVIGICRDITELKHQWQLLETRNHQLAETTRLKEEFVATTSHELRTPLTAILGFSNVLLQEFFGELNIKQKDYLERIHSSGQHLLDLINDILDLSRLEADRLELDLQMVFVPDVCEGVISLIQERALNQGLKLEVELDPNVDWMVIDPRRLKQMLLNLLTNAVKFTQEGHIGLKVYRQTSPDHCDTTPASNVKDNRVSATTGDTIHFVVWDTGIGIDEADQRSLFTPFSQIDSSLSRRHQGTGLGLVITRKLAELHGGNITLKSTARQGSTFTLSLPLKVSV